MVLNTNEFFSQFIQYSNGEQIESESDVNRVQYGSRARVALRLEAQLAATTDTTAHDIAIASTLMRVTAGEFTLIGLLVDAAKYSIANSIAEGG